MFMKRLLKIELITHILYTRLPPDGSVGKKICLQCRRHRKFGFSPWEVKDPLEDKNGNALQYSCLRNPMERAAWWATVQRVAKSLTQLSD